MSERKTFFVSVILPIPVSKEFTYRVPFEMNDQVFAGVRVIVPFGKSKLLTGIVTSVSEIAPTDYQAKYMEYVLDNQPIITRIQYQFWKWISSYYMAPIGDVMNAALPANFKLASETKIVLHPDFDVNTITLETREQDIVETLEIRESLDLRELSEIIGIKTIQPVINSMMQRRIIISQEELNDKFVPKSAVFVTLHPNLLKEDVLRETLVQLEKQRTTEKQLQALMLLLKEGQYEQNSINPVLRSLMYDQGVTPSSLHSLERKKIITQERNIISRFQSSKSEQVELKALSESQKATLTEIKESFVQHNTTLLHGVTGSGKTEIYVQLIQEQLDLGKQVLFLLPEIALTTQLIQRLSLYFGEQIGVYHSKFNQNERVEIWSHVLMNHPSRFRIIVGARSSIFLPFQDLGLIIIDEEHESSFKQYDPSPRYNGRDAAIVLGHMHRAKVLLGSATPALESYFNAQQGKYGLVSLRERYGKLKLPEVFCADVKDERQKKRMQSHFTSSLLNAIGEALTNKEQVILFQNRRGYTPLWNCEICNWTPKCKNCDVSLTYHKHTNTLKCHYCGYMLPPIGTCQKCGSNRLKMIGFGTEKVEDELALMFPETVIKRLDLDSTRSKNAYETILGDFANRSIDILIGTQMVTKGLDFDNVSLVGVLDADMLLNRPDFRAFERGFLLMSQVAGRSGRKGKRGKVIIQTGNPDHWVIKRVIDHDYVGFYEQEIKERKNFFYPPYYKLIAFTLKHKDEQTLSTASNDFARSLREVFKERVIGPEYPIIKRIQNLHLKSVILKIEKELSDQKVKERISLLVNDFYSNPFNKSVRIVIDVDPA